MQNWYLITVGVLMCNYKYSRKWAHKQLTLNRWAKEGEGRNFTWTMTLNVPHEGTFLPQKSGLLKLFLILYLQNVSNFIGLTLRCFTVLSLLEIQPLHPQQQQLRIPWIRETSGLKVAQTQMKKSAHFIQSYVFYKAFSV